MNDMVLKMKRRKKELNRENVMTRLLQLNVICRNFKFSVSASSTYVWIDIRRNFIHIFDEKYCHCHLGSPTSSCETYMHIYYVKGSIGSTNFRMPTHFDSTHRG